MRPAAPLVLALLRRCLLLGPLALRAAAGQDGDGCGHTVLTPQSGTLSSKNYPGTYPNHTLCRWRVRAPPGTSLLLAFGDVDLEAAEGCAAGSLLLSEPDRGIAHGPYCRGAAPAAPLLVTNASAVTVLFNSSSHRSGRGVLLSYATSEHPDLVSCLVKGTHYTQDHVSVYCPAGCKDIAGDIWGNVHQGYRDTSVLCKAAVHAGVIADELGGQVALSRHKGVTLYEAAVANGLRSKRGSLSEKRLVFHKACSDVLDVAAFNASSSWLEVDALGQHRAWGAERAALGAPGRSWAAEPGAAAAWLQLDLGARRNVTGIVTKGSSEGHDYYVTSYSVSSSRDGRNWRGYRGSSGQEDKLFEGNSDGVQEVSNAFIPAVVARYVRVMPQRWHQRAALKVALLGCEVTRARAPRPYAPSAPSVRVPADVPATLASIPGVALDPEKAGSTLLVMLLIGGSVLLSSGLLLLAFLCRWRRKVPAEPSCGLVKGFPQEEQSPTCSLRNLPPTFPSAAGAPDPDPSPEYAEPDVLPPGPGGARAAPQTFKAPADEGYALPLPAGHYAVPARPHEYAEPLPPESEYATPFGDAEHDGQRPEGAATPPGYEAPGARSVRDPAPHGRSVTPQAGWSGSPGAPAPAAPALLRDWPLTHVYHEVS